MSFVNYSKKTIEVKIVYFGCKFSGKGTNLDFVFNKISPNNGGKIVSEFVGDDKIVSCDFIYEEVGAIRGFKLSYHLCTVSSDMPNSENIKKALENADAVVFIADSQKSKIEANKKSMEILQSNFPESDGIQRPLLIQFNKVDVPDKVSADEIRSTLNLNNVQGFEAIATNGTGVFETFKAAAKRVFVELRNK